MSSERNIDRLIGFFKNCTSQKRKKESGENDDDVNLDAIRAELNSIEIPQIGVRLLGKLKEIDTIRKKFGNQKGGIKVKATQGGNAYYALTSMA